MITPNQWKDGRYDADFQIAHPSFMANFIWLLILTLAVVGATVALSCVTPFAALAVALAGTVGLRASLRVMIVVWLANQIIGFGLFHYPRTPDTFLMGIAIGGAAIAGTIAAWAVLNRMRTRPVLLRLGVALLASFATYELALVAPVMFLGDVETLRPAILAKLGIVNAVSLIGMIALNEILAALCRPCLGRIPRFVRSS